jgi:predicted RNA-binding protein (virulence factor B family)
LEIGRHASLRVVRIEPAGLILEGDGTSILLSSRSTPRDASIGDTLTVFVYSDAEGCPVATAQEPFAEADEFAHLKVKEVGRIGAFLDWGLDKDLLLPHGAQAFKVRRAGEWLVVRVLCDPVSHRMMASSKLRRFLTPPPRDLEPGQEVKLFFYEATDLGLNAIVNERFSGLLHLSPGEAAPRIGDRRTGFIEKLRPDGKVDLSLRRSGAAARRDGAQIVLDALRDAGGRLPLGDKSDPAAIQDSLGMSKKSFKKALGGLLRARKIQISDHETILTVGGPRPPHRPRSSK